MTTFVVDLNLYRRLSQNAGYYKGLHELLSTPRTAFSPLHPPGDLLGQSKKTWNTRGLEYQDERVLAIIATAKNYDAISQDLRLFLMKLAGIPQNLSISHALTQTYGKPHSYLELSGDWISQSSTKTLKANLEDIYMHLHEIYSDIEPET